jgi:hypothetical protein
MGMICMFPQNPADCGFCCRQSVITTGIPKASPQAQACQQPVNKRDTLMAPCTSGRRAMSYRAQLMLLVL